MAILETTNPPLRSSNAIQSGQVEHKHGWKHQANNRTSHLNQASGDFRYDEIWIRQEIWKSPSGPTSQLNWHMVWNSMRDVGIDHPKTKEILNMDLYVAGPRTWDSSWYKKFLCNIYPIFEFLNHVFQ